MSGQTGDAGLGAGAVGTGSNDAGDPPQSKPDDTAKDDIDSDATGAGDTSEQPATDDTTQQTGGQAPSGSGTSPAPTSTVISNPSGQCVPSTDGARRGDHAPEATDTYLPDCNLGLGVEYYRVFRKPDDTAYMFPRPDGHSAWIEPCNDDQHVLHEIVLRNKLCEEAGTEEVVEAVNSMTDSDALALAHYLHLQLVFYADGSNVTPWPFQADVLLVCKTNTPLRTGALQKVCDAALTREGLEGTDEPGPAYTEEEAAALSEGLNEAYGIQAELCDRLEASGRRELQHRLDASRACTEDSDCVVVGHNSACHDSCSDIVNRASSADIDAARARIEANQCASFERADCTLIAQPCPPPGPDLRCVEGICGQ